MNKGFERHKGFDASYMLMEDGEASKRVGEQEEKIEGKVSSRTFTKGAAVIFREEESKVGDRRVEV